MFPHRTDHRRIPWPDWLWSFSVLKLLSCLFPQLCIFISIPLVIYRGWGILWWNRPDWCRLLVSLFHRSTSFSRFFPRWHIRVCLWVSASLGRIWGCCRCSRPTCRFLRLGWLRFVGLFRFGHRFIELLFGIFCLIFSLCVCLRGLFRPYFFVRLIFYLCVFCQLFWVRDSSYRVYQLCFPRGRIQVHRQRYLLCRLI